MAMHPVIRVAQRSPAPPSPDRSCPGSRTVGGRAVQESLWSIQDTFRQEEGGVASLPGVVFFHRDRRAMHQSFRDARGELRLEGRLLLLLLLLLLTAAAMRYTRLSPTQYSIFSIRVLQSHSDGGCLGNRENVPRMANAMMAGINLASAAPCASVGACSSPTAAAEDRELLVPTSPCRVTSLNVKIRLFFRLHYHHLVLHGRMCSDCAAVPDAMCQQSNGTCRRAKHLSASCDKSKDNTLPLKEQKTASQSRATPVTAVPTQRTPDWERDLLGVRQRGRGGPKDSGPLAFLLAEAPHRMGPEKHTKIEN
ncbi:hypothetical protein EYF80_023573 [Liparis tanakae]|uniref:Uncharacterized protein n=1 Tax=Liparis tanakae TaxID=230148 RepID=A0A4Z2HMQ8_9TELE|nr:hypothetical protein EYF80_023573 [Liparis tanakae]